jgi:hypothetical protein
VDPVPVPWLTADDAVSAVPADGAVVLTHPDAGLGALSTGAVLRRCLRGRTRSFNAVVGWFGHRSLVPAAGAAPLTAHEEADDPGALILQEGTEALAELDERDTETGFRLLFGRCSTEEARWALWTWYWVGRWYRHDREDALGWRARVIEHARRSRDFASAAESAFALDPGDGDRLPLLSWSADQARGRLGLTSTPDRTLYAAWVERLASERPGFNRPTVVQLVTYFALRNADVRVGLASGAAGGGPEALFHPKVYVVERPSDSFVLVGSANWSTPSFTAAAAPGSEALRANVELGVLYRLADRGWPAPAADSTGARVAETARRLFEAGAVLASWNASAPAVPFTALQVHTHLFPPEGRAHVPGAAPPASTLPDDLAWAFRRMVEHVLGFRGVERFAEYNRLFASGRGFFGGRRPEPYQLDGALRLVSLLDGGNAGGAQRGVFLSDEPGLGKTLIAQMVATFLIAERLRERRRLGSRQPLYVTVVAPARLTGATRGGASDRERAELSGWEAYAEEIRQALRRTLVSVVDRDVEDGDPIDVEALLALLSLRVLSIQSFARRAVGGDGTTDAVDQAIASDFLHTALSEVVVVDEAHNFRTPTSRATRTLRLLLSLPVPGEDWPLEGPQLAAPPAAAAAPESGRHVRRSALFLTATPFNNEVGDLFTQIGHFARSQDWSPAVGAEGDRTSQYRLDLDGYRLEHALRDWRAPLPPVAIRRREPDARPQPHYKALGALLRQAAGHLEGTRRLDEPARTTEKRAAGAGRVQDGGPFYQLPGGRENPLARDFAVLEEWQEAQRRASSSPDTAPPGGETADVLPLDEVADLALVARNRMDALLTRHFVQRSRARILRHATPEDAARLFRAPRVPRHPLPLNAWRAERPPRFEAEVLAQLYELLPRVMGEAPAVQGAPGVTLFSYELSALRGRVGVTTGGEADQTVRIAVGFQVVNLIKRLQSSPYAFLRTIVRGPLRHALAELALVERALARPPARTTPAWTARLAEVRPALADFAAALRGLGPAHGPAMAGLMDGAWLPDAENRFLGTLCGALPPSHPTDGAIAARSTAGAAFQRALERFERALSGDSAHAGWAAALVDDVAAGTAGSRLWRDVTEVLGWVTGLVGQPTGGVPLVEALYDGLPALRQGQPFRRVAQDIGSGDVPTEAALAWATKRLREDPRAAALLGWLVLLAAARRDLPGRELTSALPGGGRTLVFSEYADTLDYLTALLSALHVGVAPVPRGAAATGSDAARANLLPVLARALRGVVDLVTTEAERVAQAERAKDAFTDPARFRPPVAREWFEAWWRRDAKEGHEPLRVALRDATLSAGTISSAGASYVATAAGVATSTTAAPPPDGTADDHAVDGGQVDLDLGDGGAQPDTLSVQDDPLVDAFSPWYQISPDPEDTAALDGYRRRLVRAARRPVHTLLATEVLAEGVNLQECGTLVHYDLPWNPTRLIQRNGRIDRRIAERFESEEGRRELTTTLGARDDEVPPFVPPEQVYHFTVVPAEPAMGSGGGSTERTRKVRSILLRKLRSIQALFGLSSWPVVLSAEEARQVLSGELDVETPGFRRREELFAAWRELGDPTPPVRESIEARSGSLVVFVPRGFAARLAVQVTGTTGGAEGAPGDWARLTAAVTTFWSPNGPCVPIRSFPEWSAASAAGQRAVVGTVLLRDPPTIAGWEWEKHGEKRLLLVPRLVTGDGRPPQAIRWSDLGPAGGPDAALVGPSAPTALAEDVLLAALHWLRVPEHLRDYDFRAGAFVPPLPAYEGTSPWDVPWSPDHPWVDLLDAPCESLAALDNPFTRLGVPKSATVAAGPAAGAWSLWVMVEDA